MEHCRRLSRVSCPDPHFASLLVPHYIVHYLKKKLYFSHTMFIILAAVLSIKKKQLNAVKQIIAYKDNSS